MVDRQDSWRGAALQPHHAGPHSGPPASKSRARARVFHHSAGAIVVRDGRFLALRRADNGEWVFPKGHLEEGEEAAETAVREVREETGLVVEILAELGSSRYAFGRRRGHRKLVEWFLARPVGGELAPERGFAEFAWLTAAMVTRLAYQEDRNLAELALQRAAVIDSGLL